MDGDLLAKANWFRDEAGWRGELSMSWFSKGRRTKAAFSVLKAGVTNTSFQHKEYLTSFIHLCDDLGYETPQLKNPNTKYQTIITSAWKRFLSAEPIRFNLMFLEVLSQKPEFSFRGKRKVDAAGNPDHPSRALSLNDLAKDFITLYWQWERYSAVDRSDHFSLAKEGSYSYYHILKIINKNYPVSLPAKKRRNTVDLNQEVDQVFQVIQSLATKARGKRSQIKRAVYFQEALKLCNQLKRYAAVLELSEPAKDTETDKFIKQTKRYDFTLTLMFEVVKIKSKETRNTHIEWIERYYKDEMSAEELFNKMREAFLCNVSEPQNLLKIFKAIYKRNGWPTNRLKEELKDKDCYSKRPKPKSESLLVKSIETLQDELIIAYPGKYPSQSVGQKQDAKADPTTWQDMFERLHEIKGAANKINKVAEPIKDAADYYQLLFKRALPLWKRRKKNDKKRLKIIQEQMISIANVGGFTAHPAFAFSQQLFKYANSRLYKRGTKKTRISQVSALFDACVAELKSPSAKGALLKCITTQITKIKSEHNVSKSGLLKQLETGRQFLQQQNLRFLLRALNEEGGEHYVEQLEAKNRQQLEHLYGENALEQVSSALRIYFNGGVKLEGAKTLFNCAQLIDGYLQISQLSDVKQLGKYQAAIKKIDEYSNATSAISDLAIPGFFINTERCRLLLSYVDSKMNTIDDLLRVLSNGLIKYLVDFDKKTLMNTNMMEAIHYMFKTRLQQYFSEAEKSKYDEIKQKLKALLKHDVVQSALKENAELSNQLLDLIEIKVRASILEAVENKEYEKIFVWFDDNSDDICFLNNEIHGYSASDDSRALDLLGNGLMNYLQDCVASSSYEEKVGALNKIDNVSSTHGAPLCFSQIYTRYGDAIKKSVSLLRESIQKSIAEYIQGLQTKSYSEFKKDVTTFLASPDMQLHLKKDNALRQTLKDQIESKVAIEIGAALKDKDYARVLAWIENSSDDNYTLAGEVVCFPSTEENSPSHSLLREAFLGYLHSQSQLEDKLELVKVITKINELESNKARYPLWGAIFADSDFNNKCQASIIKLINMYVAALLSKDNTKVSSVMKSEVVLTLNGVTHFVAPAIVNYLQNNCDQLPFTQFNKAMKYLESLSTFDKVRVDELERIVSVYTGKLVSSAFSDADVNKALINIVTDHDGVVFASASRKWSLQDFIIKFIDQNSNAFNLTQCEQIADIINALKFTRFSTEDNNILNQFCIKYQNLLMLDKMPDDLLAKYAKREELFLIQKDDSTSLRFGVECINRLATIEKNRTLLRAVANLYVGNFDNKAIKPMLVAAQALELSDCPSDIIKHVEALLTGAQKDLYVDIITWGALPVSHMQQAVVGRDTASLTDPNFIAKVSSLKNSSVIQKMIDQLLAENTPQYYTIIKAVGTDEQVVQVEKQHDEYKAKVSRANSACDDLIKYFESIETNPPALEKFDVDNLIEKFTFLATDKQTKFKTTLVDKVKVCFASIKYSSAIPLLGRLAEALKIDFMDEKLEDKLKTMATQVFSRLHGAIFVCEKIAGKKSPKTKEKSLIKEAMLLHYLSNNKYKEQLANLLAVSKITRLEFLAASKEFNSKRYNSICKNLNIDVGARTSEEAKAQLEVIGFKKRLIIHLADKLVSLAKELAIVTEPDANLIAAYEGLLKSSDVIDARSSLLQLKQSEIYPGYSDKIKNICQLFELKFDFLINQQPSNFANAYKANFLKILNTKLHEIERYVYESKGLQMISGDLSIEDELFSFVPCAIDFKDELLQLTEAYPWAKEVLAMLPTQAKDNGFCEEARVDWAVVHTCLNEKTQNFALVVKGAFSEFFSYEDNKLVVKDKYRLAHYEQRKAGYKNELVAVYRELKAKLNGGVLQAELMDYSKAMREMLQSELQQFYVTVKQHCQLGLFNELSNDLLGVEYRQTHSFHLLEEYSLVKAIYSAFLTKEQADNKEKEIIADAVSWLGQYIDSLVKTTNDALFSIKRDILASCNKISSDASTSKEIKKANESMVDFRDTIKEVLNSFVAKLPLIREHMTLVDALAEGEQKKALYIKSKSLFLPLVEATRISLLLILSVLNEQTEAARITLVKVLLGERIQLINKEFLSESKVSPFDEKHEGVKKLSQLLSNITASFDHSSNAGFFKKRKRLLPQKLDEIIVTLGAAFGQVKDSIFVPFKVITCAPASDITIKNTVAVNDKLHKPIVAPDSPLSARSKSPANAVQFPEAAISVKSPVYKKV